MGAGKSLEAAADFAKAIECAKEPDPEYYVEEVRALVAAGPDHITDAVAVLDRGMARLGKIVTLGLYAVELDCARRDFDSALQRLDARRRESGAHGSMARAPRGCARCSRSQGEGEGGVPGVPRCDQNPSAAHPEYCRRAAAAGADRGEAEGDGCCSSLVRNSTLPPNWGSVRFHDLADAPGDFGLLVRDIAFFGWV